MKMEKKIADEMYPVQRRRRGKQETSVLNV